MQSIQHPIEFHSMKSRHQQGFVLVTALIFLMILSVLGVMAVRGSLFEERLAAIDRDMALARENAELALRDAERDILGLRFDGQYCAAAGCTTLRPAGSRPANASDALDFWGADKVADVASVDGGRTLALNSQGVYNFDSVSACGLPVWSGANWLDGASPARECAGTIGAPVPTIGYGTFTDAPFPAGGPPPPRYILELFTATDLDLPGGTSNKLFFRITAVGFGRTTGATGPTGATNGRTSITLQSVFSPL
jgi:type IV pilus assembly protein PilX